MRIEVLSDKKELYIESHQNQNLLTMLLENNIGVSNTCHGNGTCGKCKIKVVSGYLPVTETDRRILSEQELQQGIRLACKAKTEQEVRIEIIGQSEENIVVEGILEEEKAKSFWVKNQVNSEENKMQNERREETTANHFIAIDIGTTTIAMALVDEITGEVINTYTSLNHQRKYGADVISRITIANAGKKDELKKTIEEDLWKGIKALVVTEKEINLNKIIIAGNTTMIHLLMGYSCESLGKYPFVSEHLKQIQCTLKECIGRFQNHESKINILSDEAENKLYSKFENVPVTILPGISAFVGGDIVADVVACDNFETEEICLLIDLGTNGEMVLGNKDRLLTASAAAGPAFEGGNITCGMASVPGSICQVKIQNQRAVVRTIKNEIPPNGICGTGLISAMAQLKQNKLINEDGELKHPYYKNGFPLWIFENGEKIALYQKDIREFQIAKAAIRAGIEILMEEYGCTPAKVKSVFIAGGFGKAVNIEDILTIGMLPKEFKEKIRIIGNGVLQGIIKLATEETSTKYMKEICQRAEHVSLSQSGNFQKKYVEHMKL